MADDSRDPSTSEWQAALKHFAIAHDTEHKLWPDWQVKQSQNAFARQGGTPSYDALCAHFGKDKLDTALQGIIQERRAWLKFETELQGTESPCHVCGLTSALDYYDFGLARIISEERDWKSVGISGALSAVTLPLLGAGALYGPGKNTKGYLLRMRLVICKSCVNKQKNFLGIFYAGEQRCAAHPLWKELHDVGFTKFVSTGDLRNWQ